MKPVRDKIIVYDATRGDVLKVIEYDDFSELTLGLMIKDLFLRHIDNGIMVKVGIS